MGKIILSNQLIIYTIILISCISCKKEEIPVLTTNSISSFTATSATGGGNITAEGSSTVTTRGVCWSTGTTPTIADSKTTDGAGAGSFSSNIIGLNEATIYYVRAYASNAVGTGYGMAMSFTTLGQSPTPTVAAATKINATDATLNGSVNANYLSTVVTFEYGLTISYGGTITATQSPVTGNTNINVSANIIGLSAVTIYHYRIKAVNSLGTTYSNDITFTTLGQVPTVTILATTNTTTLTAQLNGTVNANYLSTVVTFEYGKTISYGSTITAPQNPVTGNTNTNISANITGLTAGTTYHYRIVATNSLGTTNSNDMTFTTLGQVPSVTTLAATSITPIAAQLNATVNANYLSTVVTFEYGNTISYGSTATATQSPVTGNTNNNVSANITDLTVGATYHFRVKAENSLGTTYGSDIIFSAVYVIGGNANGGIIFYIDGTGLHGLVCAPTNQNTSAAWGCSGTTLSGADGIAVGTGNQNTTDIVNGCSTAGIAARICYDLDLNGYTDWFLPSIEELGLMYTNLKVNSLGSFANNFYWSSTEVSYNGSRALQFLDGGQNVFGMYKISTYYVRAVRAF